MKTEKDQKVVADLNDLVVNCDVLREIESQSV